MTRGELLRRGGALLLAGPVLKLPQLRLADETIQRFVSRPDLKPAVLTVQQAAHTTTPGYVFLAPSSGPGQRGAMIVDNRGDLVWFHPVTHKVVTDFKVQRWRGKPVLTWWEGKDTDGLGDGEWVVVDASYRELARFSAARGLHGDLHEFIVTAQNTALVLSNEVEAHDLGSVGGSSVGHVVGGVVQELSLPGGRLLWEWRSLDHVPVDETEIKAVPGPRFDYFHVNSIDVAPDGHVIISGRNTWAAYKVDRRTGRVRWRLGGKRSDFTFGPGARFEWQHDVREHSGGVVSVFDNAAAPQEEPQSRALLLELDTKRKHVTLRRAFTHRPQRVLSHFLGNAQLLEGGGVFVGWGGAPYVTEFTHEGATAFDARLPRGGQSYRAFRFPWTGKPTDRPSLAVRDGAAYASWNGATDVASWRASDGGVTPRTGFETKLALAPQTHSVAVTALDRGGAPLGTSATVAV